GRKPAKSEPTVHKDPAFDDLDDAMDYMETEDAHDEGIVKDSEETRVSTEDQVSTDKLKVSTNKLNVSTDKPNEGTVEPKDGNSDESAAPTTPLPKIDPKDKGKKVIEEKAESEERFRRNGKQKKRRRSWLRKKLLNVGNKSSQELILPRWVNKCVKKFNPYARYGVEHWKNPHAKIFYIRKQKEPGKSKEEIYSNSKIVQPDYKNLNKNNIKEIYLLIMNSKVPDYADTRLLWSLSVFIRSTVIWERVRDFQLRIESYQQKINLTTPTMTFPGIKEDHEMFSIIYEPVHGIIYKNSKKEKRVMRHSEIHKFCDATLNRVLEGLKSYNNDVKYGYVQKDLTKEEAKYLKLFEEEIEERLKHRGQMRRCEMFVNGKPLGPRRERPE
ncbi:hypothetical protein Tco_1381307, partial [Tanacetum coccineum]